MLRLLPSLVLVFSLLMPAVVSAECPPEAPRESAVGRLQRLRQASGISQDCPDVRTVAAKIVNGAFGLLGVIVVGFYIYGGFLWMTAAGESEKVETAQKILKETTIGLAILLLSFAIAQFVLGTLVGSVTGSSPPPGR